MEDEYEHSDLDGKKYANESNESSDQGGDDEDVEEEEVELGFGESGFGRSGHELCAAFWASDLIVLAGVDADEAVVADGADGLGGWDTIHHDPSRGHFVGRRGGRWGRGIWRRLV